MFILVGPFSDLVLGHGSAKLRRLDGTSLRISARFMEIRVLFSQKFLKFGHQLLDFDTLLSPPPETIMRLLCKAKSRRVRRFCF